MSLLEIASVHSGYGKMTVLEGVNLKVEKGEFVVVIGPNGAGKSTLLKTIFGFADLHRGKITYEGREISGLKPEEISPRGVAYVPQDNNIFPSLTVLENLEMSAILYERDSRTRLDGVFSKFPRLQERRYQSAGTLSGGERQMLAMGCGLMIEPRLMLLDEITGGLAPILVVALFEAVRGVHQEGTSLLMVEQNAQKALNVGQRGYILEGGKVKLEGEAAVLLKNEEVIKHFLGV
ncbi:MAG: ABC transporter ATP-binding protein [Deltaproteobacteria bacterium]|jgi:ABC-type branched-subunit amino acid transport system ATPase component|nr:ABC transporter ATP-binding protein [Deltaproteobacteria bacterium]